MIIRDKMVCRYVKTVWQCNNNKNNNCEYIIKFSKDSCKFEFRLSKKSLKINCELTFSLSNSFEYCVGLMIFVGFF